MLGYHVLVPPFVKLDIVFHLIESIQKNHGYFCVFVIVLYKTRDTGVLEKMCVCETYQV